MPPPFFPAVKRVYLRYRPLLHEGDPVVFEFSQALHFSLTPKASNLCSYVLGRGNKYW